MFIENFSKNFMTEIGFLVTNEVSLAKLYLAVMYRCINTHLLNIGC